MCSLYCFINEKNKTNDLNTFLYFTGRSTIFYNTPTTRSNLDNTMYYHCDAIWAFNTYQEFNLNFSFEFWIFENLLPYFIKYHKKVNLVKFCHPDLSPSRATRGFKNTKDDNFMVFFLLYQLYSIVKVKPGCGCIRKYGWLCNKINSCFVQNVFENIT